mmetsp:Transcript_52526/g.153009  ORF Transcript_52526/g.153009 Transcript_52526/m.153009 type:complete len:212 (-) Transcript_52526:1088-1723(-)
MGKTFKGNSFSVTSDAPTIGGDASSAAAFRCRRKASSTTSTGTLRSNSMVGGSSAPAPLGTEGGGCEAPSPKPRLFADCMARSRKFNKSRRLSKPITPPLPLSSTTGMPLWCVLAKNASSSLMGCDWLSTRGGCRASPDLASAQLSALKAWLSNFLVPSPSSEPLTVIEASGSKSTPRIRGSMYAKQYERVRCATTVHRTGLTTGSASSSG